AVAVPLGPWVEFRRKRPVLIGTDLARFAALLTIPAAFALGVLTFVQLLLVSVVVAAADITFRAASGAYLKTLLPAEDLLVANARFESTTWTTTVIGPPLGGAAIVLLGPVATVLADALSYLLSALGIHLSAPTPRSPTPGPRPSTPDPRPSIPNVRLSTPDPRPSIPNTRPSSLGIRFPTPDTHPSPPGPRLSTSD
ncbi:MFS transporter, partial [Streptosporangium algeriense]